MNNVLLTMIGASTGVGALYYLRSVPLQIWNQLKKKFIYSVTIYQYDELFLATEKYFSKFHEKQYRDTEAQIFKDKKGKKSIVYNQEENLFILKNKGKRLVVSKKKEKLDKAQSIKEVHFRQFHISGWNAKDSIDDLLGKIKTEFIDRLNPGVVRISHNGAYGDWRFLQEKKVKPLDKLFYSSNIKERIKKDIDRFISQEEWYLNTGIVYKRSYAFYGPPGTGKTTLSLALAEYLKKEIYILNLEAFDDDKDLINCFNQLEANAILLIEDVDKVFALREYVGKQKDHISFSTFINCLDGVYSKDGIITIITTNYIDKLDPALLRAGRLDFKIEIPNPGPREIEDYISCFFGEKVVISEINSLPMSEIQNICLESRDSQEVIRKLSKKSKVVETY